MRDGADGEGLTWILSVAHDCDHDGERTGNLCKIQYQREDGPELKRASAPRLLSSTVWRMPSVLGEVHTGRGPRRLSNNCELGLHITKISIGKRTVASDSDNEAGRCKTPQKNHAILGHPVVSCTLICYGQYFAGLIIPSVSFLWLGKEIARTVGIIM